MQNNIDVQVKRIDNMLSTMTPSAGKWFIAAEYNNSEVVEYVAEIFRAVGWNVEVESNCGDFLLILSEP